MARITDILADDDNVIAYRPQLRELTGCATGSILFQQILHRAKNNKWKPFFKFTKPCEHGDYREGDSWLEELGFTETEFLTARDYIAVKVTSGTSRKDIEGTAFIYYWTDANRKTWYEVDQSLTEALLVALYDTLEGNENAKPLLADYLVKRNERLTKKGYKRGLHSSESSKISDTSENEKPVFAPPEKESPEQDNAPVHCSFCDALIEWGDASHHCPQMEKENRDSDEGGEVEQFIPPRTELALLLKANTTWQGFKNKKRQRMWELKERENRDQLNRAMDWALGKPGMPQREIDRIIVSAYPKFAILKVKPKPEPQAVVAHDGGFYV